MFNLKKRIFELLKSYVLSEDEKNILNKTFNSSQNTGRIEDIKLYDEFEKYHHFVSLSNKIISSKPHDLSFSRSLSITELNQFKIKTLNNLKYKIVEDLQLEIFTHVIGDRSDGGWAFDLFDIFPKQIIVIEKNDQYLFETKDYFHKKLKKIDLESTPNCFKSFHNTPFLTYPWSYDRVLSNYLHLANLEWEQDSNHQGRFFEPFNIGFINNGNHSTLSGIFHRQGKIDLNYKYRGTKISTFDTFDLSSLLDYFSVADDLQWISLKPNIEIPPLYYDKINRSHYTNNKIKFWQLAAVYTITQLMSEALLI